VCCSVLQCVAVWYTALQCVAVCCSVLQCVTLCCNVLQCVAVWCSEWAMSRDETHSYVMHITYIQIVRSLVCCSVLQCVAVWCSKWAMSRHETHFCVMHITYIQIVRSLVERWRNVNVSCHACEWHHITHHVTHTSMTRPMWIMSHVYKLYGV